MGDIIEDLMGVWGNFDAGEKQAVAIKLAGRYQYNRLIALLNNSDMYYDTLADSESASGFLGVTQEKYMESMTAKLNEMRAAWEGLVNSFADTDALKPLIDALTQVLNLTSGIVSSIGGGTSVGAALIGTAMRTFSGSIARKATSSSSSGSAFESLYQTLAEYSDVDNGDLKTLLATQNAAKVASGTMSTEQVEAYNKALQQTVAAVEKADLAEQNLIKTRQAENIVSEIANGRVNELTTNIGGVVTANEGLQKTLGVVVGRYKDAISKLQQVNSQEKISKESAETLVQELNKLKLSVNEVDGSIGAKYADALKWFSITTDEATGEVKDFNAYVDVMLESLQKASSQLDVLANEGYIKTTQADVAKAQQTSGATVAGFSTYAQDMLSQEKVSSIVSAVGGVAQIIASMSSLYNVVSIWTDEDASFFEKFAQTLENMAFSVPMLVSSFSELDRVIKKLREIEEADRAIREAQAAVETENTDAKQKNAAATIKETEATLENASAKNAAAGKAASTSSGKPSTVVTGSAALDKLEDSARGAESAVADVTDAERDLATAANVAAEGTSAQADATKKVGTESDSAKKNVGALKAEVSAVGETGKKSAVSITSLKAAIAGLSKEILYAAAFVAVFEIVAAAYEYVTTAQEKMLESLQEAEDEATERLENISSAQEAFYEQYDSYKENGVITDELRSTLVDYNEALGQTISAENVRKDTLDRLIEATEEYAAAQQKAAVNNLVTAKNAKFNALGDYTNYAIANPYFGYITPIAQQYPVGEGTLSDVLGASDDVYASSFYIAQDADQEQTYKAIVEAQEDVKAAMEGLDENSSEYNNYAQALEVLDALVDKYSFIADDQAEIFSNVFGGDYAKSFVEEKGYETDENGKIVNDEDAKAFVDALFGSSYTKDFVESASYDTADALIQSVANEVLTDEQSRYIETRLDAMLDDYEAKSKEFIEGAGYPYSDATYESFKKSLSDAYGYDLSSAEIYSALKDADSRGLSLEDYSSLLGMFDETSSSKIERVTGKSVSDLFADSDFWEAVMADYDENGYATLGKNVSEYINSIAEAKTWTDAQSAALEDNVANQRKLAELQGDEIDEEDVTETVQGFLDSISSIEDETVRAAAIADVASNPDYNEDNLALARLGITGVDTASEAGQAMLDVKDWFASWAAENKTSMTAEAAGTYVTKVSDLIEELAGGDDDVRQALLAAIEDMDPAEAYSWLYNGTKDGTSAGVMLAANEYGVSEETAGVISDRAASIDADRAARGMSSQDTESILYDLYSYMSGIGMSEEEIASFIDGLGTSFSESTAKNDALLSVMGSKYADSTSSGGQLALAVNEAMAELGFDLDTQYAMVNETVDNIEKLADGDADAIEALTDLFDDYDPDFVAAAVKDGVENGMTANGVVKMLETGYSRERVNGIESTAARISENRVKAGGSEFDGEDLYTLYEFAEGLGIAAEDVDAYVASLGTTFDLDEAESNLVDAQMGITEETRKLLDAVGLDDIATDYRDYLMENGATADEANASAGSLASTLGTTFTESQLSSLSETFGNNAGALGDAVTKLSEAGVDGYSQFQLLARIDPDKSAEEINAQIDYMVSSGMVSQVSLLADAEEVRDVYQEAADEFSSEGRVSETTYKQLMDLDSSVAGMRADSQELGRYLNDMATATEHNADAIRDAMEESYDLDYDIDTGLFTDFEDSVRDFFDDDFSIDVEMTLDAHDASDQLIESFQEISDVIETIGDDYTVSLDDFDALYSEFGESLLENASITEDGLLQLDQATTDQMISNRQAEKDAAVQARIDELTAEQTMHEQKAQAYQAAAEATALLSAQVSAGEIQNASDVATAQGEIATELTGKLEEAQVDQATAVKDSSESQIDNIYAVGEQSDTTFSSVAANAASGSSSMATSIYTAAKNAIDNYHQMAVALKAAMNGEEAGSAVAPSSSGSSYSGTTGSKSATTSYSGGTASDYTVSSNDSVSTILSKLSQNQAYYESMASAESQLSSQLLGAITELQLSNASKYELPSSRASSGSGSSSSGSSSDSSYDPKTLDYIEDEKDLYEKVDTALDAVANDLEAVQEEQDRLTGKDLIKNMETQVGLLKEQVSLYEQKLEIQKQELAGYDAQLAGYGIQFNDQGFITNYSDVYDSLLANLNGLIAAYNAETTEEGQDALEEQIDAAQDAFDTFNDLIDKSDELRSNSIKETLKEIEDANDAIEDLMIDTFNTSLDAIDNLRELNELMAELHQIGTGLKSDNPFRELAELLEEIDGFENAIDVTATLTEEIAENVKKINSGELTEQQAQSLSGINSIYQSAIDNGLSGSIVDLYGFALEQILAEQKQMEATGSSGIFGENSAALSEAANQILESYVDARKTEEEYLESLEDSIGDALDDQNERLERQYKLYENINDDLDYQYNLISTLHSDQSYDEMNAVLQAQRANIDNMIAMKQAEVAYWETMLDKLEEGSDNWNTVADNIREAQEEIQSLIEDSISKLQEEYENFTNKALDAWSQSLLGDDLDWAQEQWELIGRNADQYLDSVNSAYETQKLQSKYLDLLDGSNNLRTQQMITQQMNEQMAYLRGQTQLSEYDVAYANAQLEILQKKIALEEAQANKSTMKLRRDSQGNYSYVYTANSDNVSSAESDLLDAQNNAYNLTKDNMVDIQSDMLSAVSDAYSKIQDIQNNMLLTQEEKNERIQAVVDSTTEYIEGLAQQLGESESHILDDFIGMVEAMDESNALYLEDYYQQALDGNDEFLTQIDERFSTSITSQLDDVASIKDATSEMYGEMLDVNEQYYNDVDSVLDSVGQSYDDLTSNIADTMDATNALTDSTTAFFETLNKESGAITQAQEALVEYAAEIADVNNKYAEANKRADELAEQLAQEQQENANLSNALLIATTSSDTTGSGGSGSGSGTGGNGRNSDGSVDVSSLRTGQVFGFNGLYYYDSWGKNPSGNMYAGQSGAVVIDSFSASKYGGNAAQTGDFDVHISSVAGGDLGWVKALQLFDTGGYIPGDEFKNNEGRLAVLHKKEIVLNADDTVNILAAVDAVRSMANQMKEGAFDAVTGNIRAIGDMFGSVADGTVDSGIDQYVTIQAEFPNADSVDEIRDAIMGLADEATQKAYRTR
jgi:hypothetical protein